MPRITDRSARLNIRLDAETREKVEQLAHHDGRTLSQTVRTLLRTGLCHYHGIGVKQGASQQTLDRLDHTETLIR